MKRIFAATIAAFALSATAAYAQGTTTPEVTTEGNDDVNRRLDTQEQSGTGLGDVLDNVGTSGGSRQETAAGVPEITDDNNDDESQRVPASN